MGIDIVQTMMSVSTLYLSILMQKTKHFFGSCASVLPENRGFFLILMYRITYEGMSVERGSLWASEFKI